MIDRLCFSLCVLMAVGYSENLKASETPEGNGLVVESYVGTRPDHHSQQRLTPFLDELETLGIHSRSAAVETIHSRHSISRQKLTASQLQEARVLITQSHAAYLNNRFDDAIASAERGRNILLHRPATMATQQHVRELMYAALITLSMANHRIGKLDSLRESMGEYIRSFPDKEISRQTYGPEGAEIYRKIVGEMHARELGSLHISAGDGAMIFINDRYVGIGTTTSKLFPGNYRVYTQTGTHAGRVHVIEISDGATETLVIDRALDQNLHTDDNFAGFVFPNESAQKRQEHDLAVALAKALGTGTIIVVGVHKSGTSTYVTARAIKSTATTTPGKNARIQLPTNTNDSATAATRLRALARYIAGVGPADPAIEVVSTSEEVRRVALPQPSRAPQPNDEHQKQNSRNNSSISPYWRYINWGVSLAALSAGAYLISINGDGNCVLETGQKQCKTLHHTWGPGLGLVAVGAITGFTGFYLWGLEDRSPYGKLSIFPRRGGLSAAISGHF